MAKPRLADRLERGCNGGHCPLAKGRAVLPRMACQSLFLFKPPFRAPVFRIVSGRYPEYLLGRKKGIQTMSDKQSRYRKHKAEQGFQRVEILVPEEAAEHLKAYARALRDAHKLGLALPLFDNLARHRGKPAAPSSPAVVTHAPQDVKKGGNSTPVRPDFSGGLLGSGSSDTH